MAVPLEDKEGQLGIFKSSEQSNKMCSQQIVTKNNESRQE